MFGPSQISALAWPSSVQKKKKMGEGFKSIGLLENLGLAVELLQWYVCSLWVSTLSRRRWWNICSIICNGCNSVASNIIKDVGRKRGVQSDVSDLMANRQKGTDERPGDMKDWENKSMSRDTFHFKLWQIPPNSQKKVGQQGNAGQIFSSPGSCPSYKHRQYWYGKAHTDFTENHRRVCANVIIILGYYSLVIPSPLEEGKRDICLCVYYI